jgi:rod shape determining protein RodA
MEYREYQHILPGAGRHLNKKPSWWQRTRIDFMLLLLILLIMSSGLVVLYSGSGASFTAVEKQLLRYGLAMGVMIFLAQIDLRKFSRWVPIFYLLGLLLLVAVLVLGYGAKGAQRWLMIPGITRFQPSELMKLVLPLMLAWYLCRQPLPLSYQRILVALLLIIVPVLMVARQPDLGTALLISCSGIFVLFFAGISWRYIIGAIVSALSALPLLWMNMYAYQKQRIRVFLNPESDPLGTGWNIIQSKIAIGSGGLKGKGWLAGTQSHLDFLPETHTDFIVAVLAEEFGLLGMVALLSLYLLLLLRCLYMASQINLIFGRLLVSSYSLTFFVYIVVNIGMVSGLLPVVGVPLPLVSYGGTSAITLLASLGLIMAAYADRRTKVEY